jgi:hypothetical protein
MATINCSNRLAQPAIKGQSVLITLNAAESASVLPVLAVGQAATSATSTATGIIDFVDTLGHQFRVKPIQQNTQINSGTTNTMANLELITITY